MPHPHADVVFLPRDLTPQQCHDKTVVVLDVLRATTTMAAALHAGVGEIRVFPAIEDAARAAKNHPGPRLLCGEIRCLPPPGFDLGNSPGAFSTHLHAGQTLYMSTTNGTRAIKAAMQFRTASQRVAEAPSTRPSLPSLYIGALINASATAQAVLQHRSDVTLLCAGTDGQIAMEDIIGAGAIIDAIQRLGGIDPATDTARIAQRLFLQARHDLPAALRDAQGGRNILAVNLPDDITYAARLDAIDVVGILHDNPLRVIRCDPVQP